MQDDTDRELQKLIASGAISGGVVGGATSLLGGAKSLGKIAKGGLIGAGLAGGLSGLSGALGLKALGSPEEEDTSGYTKRLGAGGAIAGGAAGAGLGALLGLSGMGKASMVGRGARYAKAGLMSALGRGAAAKGIAKVSSPVAGALLTGLGGAAVGGYQGADEGMQMDFLRNLSIQEKERLLREKSKEAL
jgi:hypothetical protein